MVVAEASASESVGGSTSVVFVVAFVLLLCFLTSRIESAAAVGNFAATKGESRSRGLVLLVDDDDDDDDESTSRLDDFLTRFDDGSNEASSSFIEGVEDAFFRRFPLGVVWFLIPFLCQCGCGWPMSEDGPSLHHCSRTVVRAIQKFASLLTTNIAKMQTD